MKILLSNDDGYRAQGLTTLARALAPLFEVTVVAPMVNCSGASHSLTLESVLTVEETGARSYYVDGTPADCVHLAANGMLDFQPDMVVAGINHGANLGDDVIYSGTVAAAIEGRFLGLPAIAVSLAGMQAGDTPVKHYESAAEVVIRVLKNLRARPLPQDTILNVNVPNLPFDQLRGIQATRLGARHKSQPVIEVVPRNEPGGQRRFFRVGPISDGADAGPGTDFHAIESRMVSVTPLQTDMTRYNALENTADWLTGITL